MGSCRVTVWEVNILYSDSDTSPSMDIDNTNLFVPTTEDQLSASPRARILLAVKIC